MLYASLYDGEDGTAATVPISIVLELHGGGRYDCPPLGDVDRSKRLELLHITKTGGTTLEFLAAKHNVTWAEMWWLQNATWFTAVRDPYERVVSAYNYDAAKRGEGAAIQQDARAMNAWVRKGLGRVHAARPTDVGGTDWKPDYLFRGALLIPQTEYIDERVRHILRLETLERDFLCMIRAHGLGWEWDPQVRNPSRPEHLTASNLTAENLRLVEQVYQRDFEELGYSHRKTKG